jgi:hypothetical protein
VNTLNEKTINNERVIACYGTRHSVKLRYLFNALAPIYGKTVFRFVKGTGIEMHSTTDNMHGDMYLFKETADVFFCRDEEFVVAIDLNRCRTISMQ